MQLITLATAVIGFTVTFSKEFYVPACWWKLLASTGWVLFVFSIGFGIWTLMALTGSIVPPDHSGPPTGFGFNVLFPAGVQIFFFSLGLLTFVILGVVSIWKRNQS